MHKYFISITYNHKRKTKFANFVLECNNAIINCSGLNDMQQWVYDAQKWIEKTYKLKNVVIINFIPL